MVKEDYALDDARIGAFNDAWYLFMDGRQPLEMASSLKHLFTQSIIETPCRSCDVRDDDFAICSAALQHVFLGIKQRLFLKLIENNLYLQQNFNTRQALRILTNLSGE
jgi:hypothetical protein